MVMGPGKPLHRSAIFFIILIGLTCLFSLSLVDAMQRSRQRETFLAGSIQLVRELGLTDLALFTEARYTRHPSQADLFSAFQDHPMALEHFPSGSLVLPSDKMRE